MLSTTLLLVSLALFNFEIVNMGLLAR